MAKQVKQFRFYSSNTDEIDKNFPTNINEQSLISGDTFASCMPISKLGIQAIPGTEFYLNNSTDPVIIGNTGIFELDLNDQIEIISLKFNAKSIKFISENINAYLIVDMICEGGNLV